MKSTGIMKKLDGPRNVFALGAALVLAGVVVFLVIRYWWVIVVAGALLVAAAALGWLAMNADRLSRKDFERALRRLRLSVSG